MCRIISKRKSIVVIALTLICLFVLLCGMTEAGHNAKWVEVRQILISEDMPDSDEFTYILSAQTKNAPMPEGNNMETHTFTIEGTGDGQIKLRFDKAGVYVYELRCVTTDKPGYTIDSRIYIIEVYVTDDLEVVLTYTNDGKKVIDLLFEHSFSTSPETTLPPGTTSPPPETTLPPGTPTPPPEIVLTPGTTNPLPDTPTPPLDMAPAFIPPAVPAPTPAPAPEIYVDDDADSDDVALVDLDDTGTPMEHFENFNPPLAGLLRSGKAWALWNLILTIAGVVITIIMGIRVMIKKNQKSEYADEYIDESIEEDIDDSDENLEAELEYIEEFECTRLSMILIAPILAIVGILLFILTQDMRLPMVMTDKWTIMHLILVIVGVIAYILSYKKVKIDDDHEEHEVANQQA